MVSDFYDPDVDPHGYQDPDVFAGPWESDGDYEVDRLGEEWELFKAWLAELDEAARYDLGWSLDNLREAGFEPEHWYHDGLEPDECIGEVFRSGKWPSS